jgi:hypothetical protein
MAAENGWSCGLPAAWAGRSRRVREIDEVTEHRRHRPEVTAVGGRASCIVALRVHTDPVNMVPGIMGELVGKKLRYLPDELLAVQAAQPVSRS